MATVADILRKKKYKYLHKHIKDIRDKRIVEDSSLVYEENITVAAVFIAAGEHDVVVAILYEAAGNSIMHAEQHSPGAFSEEYTHAFTWEMFGEEQIGSVKYAHGNGKNIHLSWLHVDKNLEGKAR